MLEEELRIPATRLAAAPDPKGDAELPKQRAHRGARPPGRTRSARRWPPRPPLLQCGTCAGGFIAVI